MTILLNNAIINYAHVKCVSHEESNNIILEYADGTLTTAHFEDADAADEAFIGLARYLASNGSSNPASAYVEWNADAEMSTDAGVD